ncbi:WXG100 family type VII secretion target [Mycolicibacterium aubagnense]|uniref:ESAT-6-like protein n=1 Tax=Mycolicibacterium aubagnense TaxID=319707 RepID=A0ABN5Z0U4_9MYCO|nr:WXG100 family type VII secretion target [Mycolicibacterium aubagnense]TLH58176.1 hypothetical protein C1S80_21210 [Mycolicibacterium aubagnense]WGI31594.1 WXG100 family type VII secretion target [Mycolicibacterium aubagnense]BBX86947.1 hypothetical protein MAUB_48200 [Mycolicibacterium aubagnense]
MADHLKVDPIDLHMSSAHMDMHHAELRTAHADAHADMEAAQGSWIGASAAALQAKLAEWQATTEQLCGDISAHGEAFSAAAHKYTSTDANGAQAINKQV